MKHDKIPVRVVSVSDIHGKKHIAVKLDMNSFLEPKKNYTKLLEDFKQSYISVIEEATKLKLRIKRAKRLEQPALYWRLGKLLQDFINQKGGFGFTNYRTAFQRELGLTDSFIGIILDFPIFFKESEVKVNVPMSHYFELLLKARRLQQMNKLEDVKIKLFALADSGKMPEHKVFRKMLAKEVQ